MKSSPNHSKQPARCDGPASDSSGRAWAELRVRFVWREADLFHQVLNGVHRVKRHLHQLPTDVLPERRAAALHLAAVDLRAPAASPFSCYLDVASWFYLFSKPVLCELIHHISLTARPAQVWALECNVSPDLFHTVAVLRHE